MQIKIEVPVLFTVTWFYTESLHLTTTVSLSILVILEICNIMLKTRLGLDRQGNTELLENILSTKVNLYIFMR